MMEIILQKENILNPKILIMPMFHILMDE